MRSVLRRATLVALAHTLTVPVLAGEVAQVKINDLAFVPAEITVNAGDTVEWVNEDFIDHTATANGGEWDVMVPAGKSAQVQLDHTATITYFCRVHPGMTATIHISAVSPTD